MLENLKILWHQGKQYIPDIRNAKVPGIFRGRPVISAVAVNEEELREVCPTQAIGVNPVTIDLGKCVFCGECALRYPGKVKFTTDYKLATNERERLIVRENEDKPILMNPDLVRKEIHRIFGRSIKFRQVSAAGDNSTEWELNASNNVQFDMSRFGIDFVASPRHADGVVITGPVSENMAMALELTYRAIPEPKIIVLTGTDAISGGVFADSEAIDRSFLKKYRVDLYIPGNPVHPLTFINGILDFLGRK
jgi:Ni,Fe-hydrogenase III small subunit